MSKGCIQARIYQPSNWTATLSITGLVGSQTVTVTASSTRYVADLVEDFKTALNTASSALGGDTFSVVGTSFGEGGTGLVAIAYDDSPTNFALTWVSTDLRDILGFAGNLSGATSYTGTLHARGIWLPDCEMAAHYGPNDAGHTETDLGQTVSPLGHVHTTVYSSRVRQPRILWSHVSRAKARIQGETTTNASFERFWRDTQSGERGYFQAGAPVRVIWDADTPGTYTTYTLTGRSSTEMERAVQEWAGLWPIEIQGYVVPS